MGKDPFLQSEYTGQVRDLLSKAHGQIDTFTFDGNSTPAAEVLDECRTFGLMQQHKLVIVDNADALLKGSDDESAPAGRHRRKGPRELFEDYAAQPSDAATLILRAEKWNKGKLDAIIEKVGVIKHVESPSPAAAAAWAIKRTQKRHQAKLDADAADLLIDRMGTDLGRLDTELAKLALMAGPGGSEPTITRDLVASIVGRSREEEVWSLQTALLNPDRAKALASLREALDVSGHHPTLVTWACVDLARKLHGASRGIRAGENPWALTKTLKLWGSSQEAIFAAARRLDPGPLAGLLKAAVEADWKQKTGQSDPERALETLSLCFSEVLGRP